MHPDPLVVAHRGSSFAHPEHTLSAYRGAIEEGSDGLECDVRLTSDGHLVCVHDRTVNRTSDGRGVVSERSLTELSALDFGSWRTDLAGAGGGSVSPDTDPARRQVLTLRRLIEMVLSAPRSVRLFIETKHPTRYGGLVEQQLVRMLRSFGLAEPAEPECSKVVVMSFAPVAIRRVRLLAPAVPTLLLMNRVPPFRRDGSLPAGVGWAGPGLHILRAHPGYAQRVQEAGGRVYVWTVDEPADVEHVLACGVDVIATNRPVDVLARLGREHPHPP
jgi:glycerophosphoryl diester phosphodiesterase